jgi:2-keto-3-deoxy-L-fuconate dehydrogenase
MFRLDNKIALVTGSASGIGAAIAETFCNAGAKTWIADINEKAGEDWAESLRRGGFRAEFLPLNVAEESSCEAAANRVLAADGCLDVLVNNAGIGHVGTMLQTSGADMDRLYNVNVRGVFNLTKAFLASMLERRSGNIINMASVGGIVAVRDRLAYCMTKFAVVGLTKSMALDHARDGLRVNCICPGRVETPFVQERLREYPDPEKAYREMCDTQALGRMGKPDEIAAAALYLASEESGFVTGSALMIDGGWTAGK